MGGMKMIDLAMTMFFNLLAIKESMVKMLFVIVNFKIILYSPARWKEIDRHY